MSSEFPSAVGEAPGAKSAITAAGAATRAVVVGARVVLVATMLWGTSARAAETPEEARARFASLSPEEQSGLVERWHQFRTLPPGDQAELRSRLERFARMPPERRAHITENYQLFLRLSPPEQKRVVEVLRDIRALPLGQRDYERAKLRAVLRMQPYERQRHLNSVERWRELRPEARERFQERWRGSRRERER